MRKALFLSLIVGLLAFSGIAIAADKIGTFGAPNASGTYPMEVTDDRAITVASDATLTIAGVVVDTEIYSATSGTGLNRTVCVDSAGKLFSSAAACP